MPTAWQSTEKNVIATQIQAHIFFHKMPNGIQENVDRGRRHLLIIQSDQTFINVLRANRRL